MVVGVATYHEQVLQAPLSFSPVTFNMSNEQFESHLLQNTFNIIGFFLKDVVLGSLLFFDHTLEF